MAYQALSFDDSDILVTARDDGLLNIEFRDPDESFLQGVARITPDTAVELGKILVSRGTEVIAALAEEVDKPKPRKRAPRKATK